MRRIMSRALALAVTLGATVVACGSPTFPDREPTLEGEIVGIGDAVPFGSQRTIWVKAAPDAACGVVFRVEAGTDIGERRPDDSVEERRFEDLSVGQRVKSWSGAVAESCPGQATVDAVEIVLALATG